LSAFSDRTFILSNLLGAGQAAEMGSTYLTVSDNSVCFWRRRRGWFMPK